MLLPLVSSLTSPKTAPSIKNDSKNKKRNYIRFKDFYGKNLIYYLAGNFFWVYFEADMQREALNWLTTQNCWITFNFNFNSVFDEI